MKLSTALALTVGAGVVSFVAGHLSQPTSIPEAAVPSRLQTKFSTRTTPAKASRESAEAAVRAMGKYASCSQEFSAENAVKLSSDERLDLLATGAGVGDFGNQVAMLCGVISILTREELSEATAILEGMQTQGNSQAPDVWKSLWKQWGRLDPEECFGLFNKNPSDKSPADARNVMAGWLEVHADAALVWAMEPGKSDFEAAAAALAITHSANGDLKRLESAIQKLPAEKLHGSGGTSRACMEDYFDLASLKTADQSASAIYDQLPVSLKAAAWSVAAKRIGYGDLSGAKAWVTRHAEDRGRNYNEIQDLFLSLSHEDPAGTAQWAAGLPYDAESDGRHPAYNALVDWRDKEPEAASAWMKTQRSDAPWLPKGRD